MRLYLIMLFLTILKLNEAKLTTAKSKPLQNAIIAIQIIDPNENTTSAKNSKRTIESSLGYGYQGNYVGSQGPPKYEIYRYSQHDIPPYNPNQYTAQAPSYHAPNPAPKPLQNTATSYQPGTILFSTINQQGQLGELSSQFPVSLEDHQYPIPVIILRVHPDQLANPLYPKLPQNHLHASTINSIDINSLLTSYVSNNVKPQPVIQQQPIVQQQPTVYQQHQEEYQQQPTGYQQHQEEYQNSQSYVQPQQETVQYQSSDYQSPDYQSQQYYPQYQYEDSQDSQDSQGQRYQSSQDPEPRIPDTGSNYQYSGYQVSSPVYQQPSTPVEKYKPTEMLTDENYPSDKHTQVIFKRSKGKSSTRTRHTHKSTPQVQSTKSRVSSQQIQPQVDQKQSTPTYYQPNTKYYTIQYTDDQSYRRQKSPSYVTQENEDDTQPAHSKNYVYVSSDPTYDPHV